MNYWSYWFEQFAYQVVGLGVVLGGVALMIYLWRVK